MIEYFLAAVIVVVLIMVARPHWTPVRSASSDTPARDWNMVDFPNKREAAELLARVHARMLRLMRYLKRKYHIDETQEVIRAEGVDHAVRNPGGTRDMVDHLLDNYNPDVFYENDNRTTTETSYTVNKGSAMYICLRDKADPAKLVDEETLFFTMLHEAAHIANYRGWGHGQDFWEVFKFILHSAREAGVYTPIDYAKTPTVYCGLEVAYQPLFDSRVRNIWE